MKISVKDALGWMRRYDTERYTPENRAAHRMAIDAITSRQPIPVTERMPEEYGKYLCSVKSYAFPGNTYWAILHYDKDGFHESGIYEDGVTHWMPLPDAPEEAMP